jgi:hypothetical protein
MTKAVGRRACGRLTVEIEASDEKYRAGRQ